MCCGPCGLCCGPCCGPFGPRCGPCYGPNVCGPCYACGPCGGCGYPCQYEPLDVISDFGKWVVPLANKAIAKENNEKQYIH